MNTNTEDHQHIGNIAWQRAIEHSQPAVPLTYPSVGALTHLPTRQTITGDPALEHPSANKIFLRNLPGHCYSLPAVSLNFTIVEILVFLPNWFKDSVICSRFMNNNLTANVHFRILEEHRELKLGNEYMKGKARKTLTDEYRKTMRKMRSGWTKAKHAAPTEWDPTSIAMDGFVPGDVRVDGYRRPQSIPFRDLMIGVKKAPEGVQAGDLTRALQFALGLSHDLTFPDDLPNILDHIGRTQVTVAHTDRMIIREYVVMKITDDAAKRMRSTYDLDTETGANEYLASAQNGNMEETSHGELADPFQKADVSVTRHPTLLERNLALPSAAVEVQDLTHRLTHIEGAAVAHLTHPTYDGLTKEEMEMETLLQHHQNQNFSYFAMPPAGPGYAPRHLLRECIEGNIAFDGSHLARAARFAQRPDQVGRNWCVEHVLWLIELLDAALLEHSS